MVGIDGMLRMDKEVERGPCAFHVRDESASGTRHLSLPIQYRVHVQANQNIFMGEERRLQRVSTHLSLSLSLSLSEERNELQPGECFLSIVPLQFFEPGNGGWDLGRKYYIMSFLSYES